jgi:hypothetical protein
LECERSAITDFLGGELKNGQAEISCIMGKDEENPQFDFMWMVY